MTAQFIRLQAEFSDNSIPKLYRDSVITSGTKFVFDSLDNYSWAKQAAPTPGVDTWKNLLDSGNPASFTGPIGFNKGFTISVSSDDYITLPAESLVPANTKGFVVIIWIKPGTNTGGAAVLSSGSDYSTKNQYGFTFFSSELRSHIGGRQATILQPGYDPELPVQLAVAATKRDTDGKYDLKCYKNGALFSQGVSAYTDFPQPDEGLFKSGYIGNGPSFASLNWGGIAFRIVMDDCSSKTAEQLVKLDYDDNVKRFLKAS